MKNSEKKRIYQSVIKKWFLVVVLVILSALQEQPTLNSLNRWLQQCFLIYPIFLCVLFWKLIKFLTSHALVFLHSALN